MRGYCKGRKRNKEELEREKYVVLDVKLSFCFQEKLCRCEVAFGCRKMKRRVSLLRERGTEGPGVSWNTVSTGSCRNGLRASSKGKLFVG